MRHKILLMTQMTAHCECGKKFRVHRSGRLASDQSLSDALLDTFNAHVEAEKDRGEAT